jgi:hypothetical protein
MAAVDNIKKNFFICVCWFKDDLARCRIRNRLKGGKSGRYLPVRKIRYYLFNANLTQLFYPAEDFYDGFSKTEDDPPNAAFLKNTNQAYAMPANN